jgi:hypothetical protein
MSKAEFLITVFTCLAAIASGLAAIEQHIIKKLLRKGATSKQKAVELTKVVLISRWRLNRLKDLGAIIEDDSGKYYYHEPRYKNLLKNRVIAVIAVSIIVLVVKIFYFD